MRWVLLSLLDLEYLAPRPCSDRLARLKSSELVESTRAAIMHDFIQFLRGSIHASVAAAESAIEEVGNRLHGCLSLTDLDLGRDDVTGHGQAVERAQTQTSEMPPGGEGAREAASAVSDATASTAERRKVALGRLGGDSALLDRLIDYERRRQPSANERALLDAVIESLQRDRR
jgi:hypothetical protein